MKINHIAIWVKNIDLMKEFYVKYFNAKANSKYENKEKNFQSYFLNFEGDTRIELMSEIQINRYEQDVIYKKSGLVHFAISIGSKEKVIELTNKLKDDGYEVLSEPRITGDGYFESSILDPECNIVEITI